MARRLVEAVQRLVPAGVVLACATALPGPWGAASAADLPDPTRPPPAYFAPSAAGVAHPGAEDGDLVVQAIVIAPARRSAIISGELVLQGGIVAGEQVVKITEAEVILKSGRSLRTLKIFPGVVKRDVVPGSTASDATN